MSINTIFICFHKNIQCKILMGAESVSVYFIFVYLLFVVIVYFRIFLYFKVHFNNNRYFCKYISATSYHQKHQYRYGVHENKARFVLCLSSSIAPKRKQFGFFSDLLYLIKLSRHWIRSTKRGRTVKSLGAYNLLENAGWFVTFHNWP